MESNSGLCNCLNNNNSNNDKIDDFWTSCIQEIIHIIDDFFYNEDDKKDKEESYSKDFYYYKLNLYEKNTLNVLPNFINNQSKVKEILLNFTTKCCDIKAWQENNDIHSITEYALKATCWKTLYRLMENVEENSIDTNENLIKLRDKIILNVLKADYVAEPYKYVDLIKNDDLKCKIIEENLRKWPAKICVRILKKNKNKFNKWIKYVDVSETIRNIFDLKSWHEAYIMCETKKSEIYLKLLEKKADLKTITSFIDTFRPDDETLNLTTPQHVVDLFNQNDNAADFLTKFLNFFNDKNFALNTCYYCIDLINNLTTLKCVVIYMLNFIKNDETLKKINISLDILLKLKIDDDKFLMLTKQPLDIIETFLMNTNFDKLNTALNVLKNAVLHDEFNDEKMSVDHIDSILRLYAEKSLDFRVVVVKTGNNKSAMTRRRCDGNFNKKFLMPRKIPEKDEWMENDDVDECMCCGNVKFSMFNRRHHCRRCGRIICYNCSPFRMNVETYGKVLVRACSDCYQQTFGDNSDTINITKTNNVWMLTNDFQHNKIMRDEFSYEHAPSVSLCLSIMKHHTKNVEYPKFLLQQCNTMLRLLQPGQQQQCEEIDYLLVIKMLKSVALAAKMASQEGNLTYGTSLADNILLQADLLQMLAERGCLNLLPITNVGNNENPYIDFSVIRKLKDRLLDEEQWNLALEVCTKTGLDNTGVFAAWGKACLKLGCLHLAREKFQRCLEKKSTIMYESISDHSTTSTVMESSIENERNSETKKNKSNKDPPLLKEIISILETNHTRIPPEVISQLEKKIKNVKNSNQKNQEEATTEGVPEIFYDECIFYLRRYGSNLSSIKFFLRHKDVHRALHLIIDNNLNYDVFIYVYMQCSKDVNMSDLMFKHMSAIDSTLDLWKGYLRHICRHLEKSNMLDSLYKLQQFMGDYIRAAMTCIRFYQEDVDNFRDFSKNVQHLMNAKEHLRHVLEQEQWVDVAHAQNSKNDFVEKAITNPSLVMKMDHNEINKHMRTITKQNELVDFLSSCEENGENPVEILRNLGDVKIPTLFGSYMEKCHLIVACLVCANSIEEGFNFTLSFVKYFNVKPTKVYCEAGKQLAKLQRYECIIRLVNCLKLNNNKECTEYDKLILDTCDEILESAVATFNKNRTTTTANVASANSKTKVEDLIKLISDLGTKISAYIEAKQLKTAYYLAVKYKKMSHVRRIMKEAEVSKQPSIRALCQKVLHNYNSSQAH